MLKHDRGINLKVYTRVGFALWNSHKFKKLLNISTVHAND